jgi:hypothetical protein
MFEKAAKKRITIADLYPDLTPEEQAEAEYNLKQYLSLVWRIYQRVKRENPEMLTKALEKARFNSPEENNTKGS